MTTTTKATGGGKGEIRRRRLPQLRADPSAGDDDTPLISRRR
jgi:hypothetical protein